MLIQRISRSDPERAFVVVRADETGITKGWPVSFNMDGTRNGIDVVQTDAAADLGLIVGNAHADIANTDYGLAQAYGYDDDGIYVKSNDTPATVGSPLGINSASSTWKVLSASIANVCGHAAMAAMAEAITTGTGTSAAKMFLRLL